MTPNRIWSLGVVVVSIGLARVGPRGTGDLLVELTLALGYGHIAGACWSGRSRRRRRAPAGVPPGLWGAMLLVSGLSLFQLYAWALTNAALRDVVLVALLLLGAWHIFENDVALGRAYSRDLCLGREPLGVRGGSGVALATATAVALAICTEIGAGYAQSRVAVRFEPLVFLRFEELASGVLLYHVLSWARFFWDRARRMDSSDPCSARRLRRVLLGVHLVPVGAVLVVGPLAALATPAVYLFWSALHALQTSVTRAAPCTPGHVASGSS